MRIDRATKRSIDESPDLLDMSDGVQMFFQSIKIDIIHKYNEDGYIRDKKKCIITQGVRVTMSPAQLMMRPEGERTWRWSKLFTLPEPRLKLDDIVQVRGVKYRVMSMENNSEYGVMSYDLLEDYQNES